MKTRRMKNIEEAVEIACKEPTLVEALGWIATWEGERAIQQAKRFFETGERTGSDGAAWDFCFTYCFERVIDIYNTKENNERHVCKDCEHKLKWRRYCKAENIEHFDSIKGSRYLYRKCTDKNLDGECKDFQRKVNRKQECKR